MRFPIDNWQFWIATLIFLAAVAWVLRSLPIPFLKRRRSRGRQKATLTIGGKSIE